MTWYFQLTPDWFNGNPLSNIASQVLAEATDDFVCARTMQEILPYAQGPVEGNPDIPVMSTNHLGLDVPLNMIGATTRGPGLQRVSPGPGPQRRRRRY